MLSSVATCVSEKQYPSVTIKRSWPAMAANSRQPPRGSSLFNPLPSKSESAVPPERRRASKPKVRSGCLTCKRRHVKCDEGKPGCRRCAKAELVCTGYASDEPPEAKKPPPPVKQTRLLLPRLESQARIAKQQPLQQLVPLQPGTHWASQPVMIPAVPSLPFFQSPTATQDAQYFDLFQNRLIHDLLGLSCSNFWSRTVLRESMRDPCIRHSLLAISALARGLYLGPDALPADVNLRSLPASAALQRISGTRNADHEAALGYHTKAVSMFRNRISLSQGGESPRSILIATLLFVAYEHLQGNTEAAEQLVTRGLVLLRDSMHLLKNHESESGVAVSLSAPLDDDMIEIKLLLSRLGVVSNFSVFCPNFYYTRPDVYSPAPSSFGSAVNSPAASIASIPAMTPAQTREAPLLLLPFLPTSFPSPGSALPDPETTSTERVIQLWTDASTRALLWVTRYPGHNLCRNAKTPAPYDIVEAETQQMEWLRQITWWRSVLSSLSGKAEKDLLEGVTDPDNWQLRALRLAHIHVLVVLSAVSTCLDATHLVLDQNIPLFKEVVERCEVLCNSHQDVHGQCFKQAPSIRFTFDIGVVPALSTVAAVCRDREVRLKALELLKPLVWWREAGWDARAYYIGCEALIELEEKGAIWIEEGQSLDGGPVGMWFIPPEARYVWTAASWDLDRGKMLAEYTRTEPDEQGNPVLVRMELDIIGDCRNCHWESDEL